MIDMENRQFDLPSGVPADVLIAGSGPALLFLHDHLGREWNGFLDALAENHTVYAPRHPGSDEPDELQLLDGFADLALYYDDLLNALELDTAISTKTARSTQLISIGSRRRFDTKKPVLNST